MSEWGSFETIVGRGKKSKISWCIFEEKNGTFFPDGEGESICSAKKKKIADQIAREHNAHKKLVDLIRKSRNSVNIQFQHAEDDLVRQPRSPFKKEKRDFYLGILRDIDAILNHTGENNA